MTIRIALAFAAVAAFMMAAADGTAQPAGCRTGEVKAFAAVRFDPNVAPAIPAEFSSRATYFWRRYNCSRRGVQIRRLGLGTFEIRFSGVDQRPGVATVIGDDAASASVRPLAGAVYRVSVRGPLAGGPVAERRDLPFTIVLY